LRDAETYRTVVEKPPLSINQKEQKAKNMNLSLLRRGCAARVSPHFFEFFSLYWFYVILHGARRFLPPKDCVPAFLY
jgi:hypothetical protein